MRHWTVLCGMAVCGLLLGVVWLYAQSRPAAAVADKKDKRTITTSGTATIVVKPDSARVFFGVQTIAKTVKAARDENSTKAKAVLDALQKLQIPNLRTKTADVHVDILQSQRGEAVLPEILGYRVNNNLTALIRDTDSVKLSSSAAKVLDTALENGVNTVQQIIFFKENEAEVRRQALSKAVEDGVANARALAAGAKVNVADVIIIDDQPDHGAYTQTLNIPIRPSSFEETPVLAGDLEVTCRVSVTCTY